MNLTDTHCHLYLPQFKDDLDEVLNRAVKEGVKQIFLPAIDWKSVSEMDQLTHPEITFYKMAGIHPCEVTETEPDLEEKLGTICSEDRIVAVGETGLDYYWSKEHIKEQKESLRIHCCVARATGKPVVLHNRESTTDLLDIIDEEQDGNLTGVWHCFTGTEEEGKRAIDLGFYLGVGGVATFKNAGVGEIIAKLPIDKLLPETDAPYLAPHPKRGKRNEPAYIAYTAKKLARLKGRSVQEIADITTDNAIQLFSLAD